MLCVLKNCNGEYPVFTLVSHPIHDLSLKEEKKIHGIIYRKIKATAKQRAIQNKLKSNEYICCVRDHERYNRFQSKLTLCHAMPCHVKHLP